MACKKTFAAVLLALFLSVACSPALVHAGSSGQITTVDDFTHTFDKSAFRYVSQPGAAEKWDKQLTTHFYISVCDIPDMSPDDNYLINFKVRFSLSGPVSFNSNGSTGGLPLPTLNLRSSISSGAGTTIVTLPPSISGSIVSGSSEWFDISYQCPGVNAEVGSVALDLYTETTPIYVYFPAITTTSYLYSQTVNYTGFLEVKDISYEKLVGGDDLLTETKKQTEIMNEQAETSKGILASITDFFGSFFDNLRDFIVGLIIPSADDITSFFGEVNDWFSERLGFIWYPFDLMLDLVSAFATGDAEQDFKVPALSLNLLGSAYQIWDGFEVDMDAFGIFQYVRYFTSALLVSGIVKMAISKWDEWIGGHGT